jgi:hypothetical protein
MSKMEFSSEGISKGMDSTDASVGKGYSCEEASLHHVRAGNQILTMGIGHPYIF